MTLAYGSTISDSSTAEVKPSIRLLRREVLKQLRIDSIEDLRQQAGGAWAYLTESWLSLRLDDNANASRRTVQPWWQAVQAAARDFGSEIAIERDYAKGGKAPVEWYVSHGAGCLVGFAARQGLGEFADAFGSYADAMIEYWQTRCFDDRYRVERIKLGFSPDAEGGDDAT